MTEITKRPIITKPARLTFTQRRVLERECSKRFNWTDSGKWMGTGREPDCYIRDSMRNSISHTYYFPTEEAANKWNLEWEKNIRYAGHMGTTALTVALVSTNLAGAMAMTIGTLAAITKDEIQAAIQYPKVDKGCSYTIEFKHQYKWSSNPYGLRYLTQTIKRVVINSKGEETFEFSKRKKYQLSELPPGLGYMLTNRPSKRTSSDYK